MTTLLSARRSASPPTPSRHPGEGCVSHHESGGRADRGGPDRRGGRRGALAGAHPGARVVDYGRDLILPGFVDAHMHYPQTGIVASWGKRLIDWLNSYTFPRRCGSPTPPMRGGSADRTLDLALAHGTTTLCSFCTIHRERRTPVRGGRGAGDAGGGGPHLHVTATLRARACGTTRRRSPTTRARAPARRCIDGAAPPTDAIRDDRASRHLETTAPRGSDSCALHGRERRHACLACRPPERAAGRRGGQGGRCSKNRR
jgi:guanine deaminase